MTAKYELVAIGSPNLMILSHSLKYIAIYIFYSCNYWTKVDQWYKIQ